MKNEKNEETSHSQSTYPTEVYLGTSFTTNQHMYTVTIDDVHETYEIREIPAVLATVFSSLNRVNTVHITHHFTYITHSHTRIFPPFILSIPHTTTRRYNILNNEVGY